MVVIPNGAYEKVGAEIITFVPYLFVIPLSLYGNILLYRTNKSDMFAQKRRLPVLFGLNAALLFGISAALNFHISAYYAGLIGNLNGFIYCASYWSILFFLLTRTWLVYYRYKWTYYALQSKWQSLINKNVNQNENNWYIKNNHKYGKFVPVAKRFCVLASFGMFWLTMGMFILKEPIALFAIGIAGLLIFVANIFYCVIICKTPYYNDIFHIHWESKLFAKLLLFTIIMVLLLLIVLNRAIESMVGARKMFAAGIVHPFTAIMFGSMIYVSTFGIMKKNKLITLTQKLTPTNSFSNARDSKKHYTVDLMLSTERSVNLFMQHLAKEYSMETLLSYIEFCQYQKYIVSNDNDNTIEADIKDSVNGVQFPSSIPMSEIIEFEEELKDNDYDKMGAYKIKAHKLYAKYVRVGSEFEINVASSVHIEVASIVDNLDSFMDYNINLNDLVLLFEACGAEMRVLLSYSLTRFKGRDEFEEVEKMFEKEMQIVVSNTT